MTPDKAIKTICEAENNAQQDRRLSVEPSELDSAMAWLEDESIRPSYDTMRKLCIQLVRKKRAVKPSEDITALLCKIRNYWCEPDADGKNIRVVCGCTTEEASALITARLQKEYDKAWNDSMASRGISDGRVPKEMGMSNEILEALSYDSETGELRWKELVKNNRVKPGDIAGSRSKSRGHVDVMIHGKHIAAHRIAWFLYNGYWPMEEIDHINGIRHDNRIANLRLASRRENAMNKRWHREEGKLVGACFDPKSGKYQSRISKNGKNTILGMYPTAQEAHERYLEEAETLMYQARDERIRRECESKSNSIISDLLGVFDALNGKKYMTADRGRKIIDNARASIMGEAKK